MRFSDFILPFCIALIIHIGLFLVSPSYHDAKVIYKKGVSVVRLSILHPVEAQVCSKGQSEKSVNVSNLEKQRETKDRQVQRKVQEKKDIPLNEAQVVKHEDHRSETRVCKVDQAYKHESTDGALEEKGVNTPAVIADLPMPRYPVYSRRHGEQGSVMLSVEVLKDGTHGRIGVISSSGNLRLDRAAMRALDKAKFIPAKKSGVAVASQKEVTFTFKLED
ncbi:MAG: energy transducer TonB [Thermodesulfobacteriota bacterium]|nr:energy transducer TonB [Thermodesulfobacteriota bacterium]